MRDIDQLIWAQYFASIVGMNNHPGNKCPDALHTCAELADAMLIHHNRRFGGLKWPSSQESSPAEQPSSED